MQSLWLRLLRDEIAPGEIRVEPIEAGYFAVVISSAPEGSKSPASDFLALRSRIGDLAHTRAVYLDASSCYGLTGGETLRMWAGEAAAVVESGARRAFAVVDVTLFMAVLRTALEGQGWQTEERGENLRVSSGHFCDEINVLREVVRMVFGREDFAMAVERVAEETALQFARDAEFFARFKRRFAGFAPATLDHFFVAYPEQSCVAVGWDYWHLAGQDSKGAGEIFEQGMDEFEVILRASPEDRLPGLADGHCGRAAKEN